MSVKKEIFDWIKSIAMAIVLAFVILQFIRPSIVSGESMYPTLDDKDYLILNRISYKVGKPEKGDIVVFKTNLVDGETGKKKDLIKRVIATEGDSIKISNSKVYVNGKLLNEPYIHNNYTSGDIDTVVPKGKLFTMGDNRENSNDSRFPDVGMVDEDEILGKVMVRLLPLDNIGKVE
ncbi:signal peptidase I [Clostridioides sp. ES-S-0108-01]|uniref:signal peptidase I n=1 Tax=unclassified Clostridioides TaxID=2635829 RepID=UPI001D0CA403|nr:signal peptidase I [Clostridioides sp. ES-S-0171-01]MCC0687146.1 signal peptidase I [Clostridioides sp. ES-S-0056-01]MCC0714029.1 signal peptidase I [Clostridioides sp. ES-S-0077-01]MCC0783264.1 signal peptidase I [Clostridioides sp. ES-S-0108-01]UDN52317.1 signal peptidase I [Clostridioides sp. ES-S-0107-01]UDN55788.1 signal peptidase I [Clostridioides sp. ES-S-0054-01]